MNFADVVAMPVKLRQSAATCALECERKWLLQYRFGVGLRGGEFYEAAELGTIFHRLMRAGPGGEEAVKDWLRDEQLRLVRTIEAGGDLDGTLARRANKLFEMFNIAQAAARIFQERFPQSEDFQVIGAEITHECHLEGVLVAGTIDKLLQNRRTGDVWIRDYKFTGRPLDTVFAGASWGIQGMIYRVLAGDLIGRDARGFILDGVARPGIKMCRTDETNAKAWGCTVEEAYLRRVKEWYTSAEALRDDKVMRSMAVLFHGPVDTIELRRVLGRFREYTSDEHPVPTRYCRDVTRQACTRWGRLCPYHDLCCTNPENWDALFETKYEFKEREEAQVVEEQE